MSIATRPPGSDCSAAAAPASSERPGDGQLVDIAAPSPGDLLPPVGMRDRDPVPAPARALALDARRLLRRSADPAARPAHWSAPAFAHEVATVRAHLAPLRSRRALAASFGREAFHRVASPDEAASVRIAYAIRWDELGPGAESAI